MLALTIRSEKSAVLKMCGPNESKRGLQTTASEVGVMGLDRQNESELVQADIAVGTLAALIGGGVILGRALSVSGSDVDEAFSCLAWLGMIGFIVYLLWTGQLLHFLVMILFICGMFIGLGIPSLLWGVGLYLSAAALFLVGWSRTASMVAGEACPTRVLKKVEIWSDLSTGMMAKLMIKFPTLVYVGSVVRPFIQLSPGDASGLLEVTVLTEASSVESSNTILFARLGRFLSEITVRSRGTREVLFRVLYQTESVGNERLGVAGARTVGFILVAIGLLIDLAL